MTDPKLREQEMRTFWSEMDRQCGAGAGTAETNGQTGLLIVHADIDPFGMADAMIAFAAAIRSTTERGGAE